MGGWAQVPSRLVVWLRSLFHKEQVVDSRGRSLEPSKEAARRRLQLVLVQDRVGLSPELLEAMKNDLLNAISKYVVIQSDSVEMQITRNGDSVILVSNIRVAEVRRPAPEPR